MKSVSRTFFSLFVTLSLVYNVSLTQVQQAPIHHEPANDLEQPLKHLKLHSRSFSLSAAERHILSTLTHDERRKIQEAGHAADGVTRTLSTPLALSTIASHTALSPTSHVGGGLLTKIKDEGIIWSTYIQSQGAKELRVFFESGYLPQGCQIYLYNDAGEVFGPYAFNGSIQQGGFWSNILSSDHAFVELQISPPALDSLNFIQLYITQIAHIEFSLLDINEVNPQNAPLEDVNCSYANAFSSIGSLKSATARIRYVQGSITGYGSGGLLSNHRGDFQPFLLTANHVISSQTVAQTVVALFDYRTTSCNGSVQSGTQILAANLCATNTTNDFTLLLLKQKVPAPRVYLGWTTASVSGGTILHSVHHPNAGSQKYTRAEKKNTALECTGAGYGPALGGPNYYMKMQAGGTRDGSSGGVVVNPDGQVVGQIRAVCGNDLIASYLIVLGRFDESYNNNALSFWLVSGASSAISLSTSSLNFGTRTVGSNTDLDVTIYNTSTISNGLNLQTGTAYISGSNSNEFSILSGADRYIPPNDNALITIRFSPGSAGSKTATLVIPHTASNVASPRSVTLTATASNPTPSVTSLSPSSRTAGGSAFTLTVNGSGFVNGSLVRWNGSNRTTTYVSSTQLTASIIASDIATAGTANVTVFNSSPGGGTSGSSTFTINNPSPSITSLSPNSRIAGGSGFTLTVNGSGFVNGSLVRWNGSNRTTTYVSSTQLTASITASDIATAGTANVTVFNSSPGGGTSGSSTFTINNPIPAITSLSPDSATAGGPAFTLTVNGSDFASGTVVRWNGSNRTTNYASSTRVTASISAGDIASAGSANVTVFNPSPGGGSSDPPSIFTINTVVSVTQETQLPTEFRLAQNFPNPFNPSTQISFDVPTESRVVIKLFNVLGQEIHTLVDEQLEPGRYSAHWNADDSPTGIYLCIMQAREFVVTRKIILLR